MTTEVTAIGTRCTFCEVQRNAVGGSSPLRGEREPLVGRQASDRGARQDNETDSLLPRSELTEASHRTSVSGSASRIVFIFTQCGAFPCRVCITWNVQRATPLFPFDCSRRFGAYVVHHPIHAADLVDDPAAHLPEHLRRKRIPVRRHPIPTRHGPQRDHVIVCAEVSHHAH